LGRDAVELDDDVDGGVSFLRSGGCFGSQNGDFRPGSRFFETIIQSIYKMLELQWYKDSSPKTSSEGRLEFGSNDSRTFGFRSIHLV
jgi:hypothetical protein